MRVVIDTNIFISALIRHDSVPGKILDAWLDGRIDLLTHPLLIEEMRVVSRREHIRALIRPSEAGRLMNQIRTNSLTVEKLPRTRRSADPADDFLLALCEAGQADYLVTGDKSGLLALGRHGRTTILTARGFLDLVR